MMQNRSNVFGVFFLSDAGYWDMAGLGPAMVNVVQADL